MNNLTRCALLFVLIPCCVGFPPLTYSQTKTVKKAPMGTVSGRVTIKGKGAPGVIVGVRRSEFSPQPGPGFKATTDQDGNYRITEVPAGSYQVAPIAPALVISDFSAYGPGKVLLITEGEKVDGFDFALVSGGVITGRVTDSEGRPVIDEHINVLPADPAKPRGPSYPLSLMGFQTDDRGIYRIYGVPSGLYKVAVGQSEDGLFQSSGMGRAPYKQTFHPDTTDPAKATVIEIAEGTEATNIDVTLSQTIQGRSVSGRVVSGEGGQPVANIRLGLTKILDSTRIIGRNSSTLAGGDSSSSNSKGEFRIANLSPGKYMVLLSPVPDLNLSADPVTFDVLDQDVKGLIIKTSVGASISGMVVIEGSRESDMLAKLAQFHVSAYVRSEGSNDGVGRYSQIKSDGSFRIGGLPAGAAYLSISGPGVNKGILISRIERDGGVVQPGGLQIQNGEQITGVRIIVAYGNGGIRGVVKIENGALPSGGSIFVRVTKTGGQPNFRPPDVDARGHFLVDGLSAGSYELDVSVFAPESRPYSSKQLVNVTEGGVTEVTVTIDLKQNLDPIPKP